MALLAEQIDFLDALNRIIPNLIKEIQPSWKPGIFNSEQHQINDSNSLLRTISTAIINVRVDDGADFSHFQTLYNAIVAAYIQLRTYRSSDATLLIEAIHTYQNRMVSELHAARQTIITLQNETVRLQDQITDLTQKVNELNRRIIGLDKDPNNENPSMDGADVNYERTLLTITSIRNKLREYASDLDTKTKVIAEVNDQLGIFIDKKSSLESHINTLNNTNSILEHEKKVLSSRLEAGNSESDKLRASHSQLDADYRDICLKNATQEQRVNELESRIREYSEENVKLKRDKKQIKKQNLDAMQRLHDLEKELDRIKARGELSTDAIVDKKVLETKLALFDRFFIIPGFAEFIKFGDLSNEYIAELFTIIGPELTAEIQEKIANSIRDLAQQLRCIGVSPSTYLKFNSRSHRLSTREPSILALEHKQPHEPNIEEEGDLSSDDSSPIDSKTTYNNRVPSKRSVHPTSPATSKADMSYELNKRQRTSHMKTGSSEQKSAADNNTPRIMSSSSSGSFFPGNQSPTKSSTSGVYKRHDNLLSSEVNEGDVILGQAKTGVVGVGGLLDNGIQDVEDLSRTHTLDSTNTEPTPSLLLHRPT